MSLRQKIKEKWNNYLKRLSEANREVFGREPLDCCKLNRKPQKNK